MARSVTATALENVSCEALYSHSEAAPIQISTPSVGMRSLYVHEAWRCQILGLVKEGQGDI